MLLDSGSATGNLWILFRINEKTALNKLALGEMQTSGLKESCRYTSEGKREVHKVLP